MRVYLKKVESATLEWWISFCGILFRVGRFYRYYLVVPYGDYISYILGREFIYCV